MIKRRSSGLRVFGDTAITLFMVVAGVLFLLLPIINDAAKKDAEAPSPQGNLIVELYWPDGQNIDVDLWVKGEADGTAVGYSNKGGPLFNLLRDDLGNTGDISGKNQEIAYSRGIPDGEYIINAHLFALKEGKVPVPITLIVSMKSDDNSSYKQLFKVTTELKEQGEERTIARFVMYDKEFIKKSFNTIQEKIRAKLPSTESTF